MPVNALSNQSLAGIGCVGAFAAAAGGVVYFKATGTVAVVGGVAAAVGVIALLAAAIFAAYRYYYPSVPAVVSNVAKTKVLVYCILKFLPEKEILSAERVNKSWKRWASGNAVWKYLCDQEGIPPIRRPGTDPQTKQPIQLLFYKEAYQHLYPIIFGPKQYSDHLHVKVHGDKVRLQDNIHEKLDQLDHLLGQRKYRLIYLSRDIERTNLNGTTSVAQMTMNLLGELVEAPGLRHPTRYSFISNELPGQYRNATLEQSDWVLLSSDVVQGTRTLPYNEPNEPNQLAIVSALGLGARPPKFIEAIALNFFNHVRFGTYLYGHNPWTYTRVDTAVTVNNTVYYLAIGNAMNGAAGLSVYLILPGGGFEPMGLAAAYSCGSSAAIGT